MSWHCSLELVEEFSQAKVWVTGSCVRWKKIRIAERSLCGVKKIKASQSSPSGTTLTPSTGTPGMALSMSFLLDFHAKDSPLQESKKEQTTPEINGQRLPESSEKYAQAELFSKTFQESESTSESWPETLPIWGTIVSGELFPLEKPELDISANDGGAWPTPSVTDSGGGIARDTEVSSTGSFSRKNKDGVRWGVPLRDAVPAHEKKWPTPQARDWKNGHGPRYVNKERSNDLNDAVDFHDKKWPTPTASDHKGGTATPRKDTGVSRNDRLDHCLEPYAKGRLNPDWVEWLMGWPIGWTSLDFMKIDMKRWWNYSMITEPAKYWEEDPADIPVGEKYHTPRLTSKKEYRVDRLKCCGNGQVPQQVILALKMLP